MFIGLLEYFDLLSSVYNSNVVWFFILSFKYFEECFGEFFALQLLMLTQSLAPFACLCSFCKFSIIGLISGLKFSLLYKFSFLSYFSLKIVIFSWVVEFLENISSFSLKQDLVYSHQSLSEERVDPRLLPERSYKIGSVCPTFHPSFHLCVRFLGIGSLVFSET